MTKPHIVIIQNKILFDMEAMLKLFSEVAYKYTPNINNPTMPINFNINLPAFTFLFKFKINAITNMNGKV